MAEPRRSVGRAAAVGGATAISAVAVLAIVIAGSGAPLEPEHHTLKITTPDRNPSEAARQDLLKLLADCTKQNLSFGKDGEVVDGGNVPGAHYEYLRGLKDEIIASGKTVELKVVAGPHREVFVDDWGAGPVGDHINGLVDMSDINTYPQDVPVDSNRDGNADGMAPEGTWVDTNEDNVPDRPAANAPRPIHAMTRCTLIAHILGERFYPLQSDGEIDDYHISHMNGGFGSENALQQERPVDDKSKSEVGVEERIQYVIHDGHKDVVTTNDDGSGERAHVTGADGTFTITYFPAPPRTTARTPSSVAAASSTLRFEGCVRRVSDPPDAWSGVSQAYQEVRYRVRDVLRGRSPGRRVSVLHTIVQGDSDVLTEEPGLRKWVHPGAAVRVRATPTDSEALGSVYVAEARIRKDRSSKC